MLFRLVLVITFVLSSKFSPAQKSDCNQIFQFKKLLDEHHITPQVWNDKFALKVVHQMFGLTDPQGLFFTKSDIAATESQVGKWLNSLQAADCYMVHEFQSLYLKSLSRAEQIVHEISKTPITFSVNDTLEYNYTSGNFPSTEANIKKRWLQWVKFAILNEVVLSGDQINVPDLKLVAEKIIKRQLNIIKRKREAGGDVDKFVFTKLMNAIAKSYDPHTEFFPASEKQAFIDMLAATKQSYGLLLNEDAIGNVVISRIIPGSSAWNMKRIHIGDVVTEIRTEVEILDASLYNSDELNEVLESVAGELELSVRQADGEEITLKLKKLKIDGDENKIKSLVFSNANQKYGYISLPVFFTKDELSNSGCANELVKEIIHLKQVKVKGLILDLRFNGGGDLYEALDLAGAFIDRGALAVVQQKNNELVTLKDTNLGTAYDGPLVVMINAASASAAELFASIMRDYNRAVLLGGTTYGKGTGQSLMYLNAEEKEAVKVTTFLFYSPLGNSNQGDGINPDIYLPDLLSEINYHESGQQHALAKSDLKKRAYLTPLKPLPLEMLRDSSVQRLKRNPYFIDLADHKQLLNNKRNEASIRVPLTIEGFKSLMPNEKNIDDDVPLMANGFSVYLTSFDEQINKVDAFGQEVFKELIDDVSGDYYISEALQILRQLVDLK